MFEPLNKLKTEHHSELFSELDDTRCFEILKNN